jgi:excisionase family DNA binding protein
MMPEGLLTVAQVAAALSVSRTTVYNIIHAGRLKSVRRGNNRWVRPEDLGAFIESSRPKPLHLRTGPDRLVPCPLPVRPAATSAATSAGSRP